MNIVTLIRKNILNIFMRASLVSLSISIVLYILTKIGSIEIIVNSIILSIIMLLTFFYDSVDFNDSTNQIDITKYINLIAVVFGVQMYVLISSASSNFKLITSTILLLIIFLLNKINSNYKTNSKQNSMEVKESPMYFRILKNPNPIESECDDELNRKEFAKKIAMQIASNPNQAMTYGICGQWGVGKTSLVNLIYFYLDYEKINFEKIVFSSWHYQSSEKIIDNLFDKISKKITILCDGSRHPLYLLKKIRKTAIPKSLNIGTASIGASFDVSITREKEMLSSIIDKELKSQLIIFIDDLDRLDSQEFFAVIRAVRLLSDIPKIKFILAYDKLYIKKIMFGETSNGFYIDYLSKLVQQEFMLAPMQSWQVRKLIENILNDEFNHNTLNVNMKNDFIELISNEKLMNIISMILCTPREIRKILASSLSLCSDSIDDMRQKYNYLDFFILTIIQYKYPIIYNKLQYESLNIINRLLCFFEIPDSSRMRPEWYSIEGDELKKVKESILCLCDEEADKVMCWSLITYLLSVIFSDDGTPIFVKYIDTYERKKFMNPDLYEIYFQYSLHDELVNLNQFIDDYRMLSQDDKIDFNASRYAEVLGTNRYFDIVRVIIEDGNDVDSIKKLIHSIAKNYYEMNEPVYVFIRGKSIYASRCVELIKIYKNKNIKNFNIMEMASDIIKFSKSYGFSLSIIKDILKLDEIKEEEKLKINTLLFVLGNSLLEKQLDDGIENIKIDDMISYLLGLKIEDLVWDKIIFQYTNKPNCIKSIMPVFSDFQLKALENNISSTRVKRLYNSVKDKVDLMLFTEAEKNWFREFTRIADRESKEKNDKTSE